MIIISTDKSILMNLNDARPIEDNDGSDMSIDAIDEDVLTNRQIAVLIAVLLILLMLGFAVLRYWMINSYG